MSWHCKYFCFRKRDGSAYLGTVFPIRHFLFYDSRLLIPCKKSRYLMISNQCDTINLSIVKLQYFNENLVILLIQHLVSRSILTNFQVSIYKVKISSISKTQDMSDLPRVAIEGWHEDSLYLNINFSRLLNYSTYIKSEFTYSYRFQWLYAQLKW